MVLGINLWITSIMYVDSKTMDKSKLDKFYRVRLSNDTNRIEVSCFGMDAIDSELEGTYSDVEELPLWIRERLAVLMVTTWKPVTKEIAGVGRRIDKTTFWICSL